MKRIVKNWRLQDELQFMLHLSRPTTVDDFARKYSMLSPLQKWRLKYQPQLPQVPASAVCSRILTGHLEKGWTLIWVNW